MTAITALLLLLAIPFVASPLAYLAGRTAVRLNAGVYQRDTAAPARWIALLGLLVSWVPLVIVWQSIAAGSPVEAMVGTISLHMDGIGLVLALTALALGTLVTIFSFPYMAGEEGEEKYYALLPALVGSMVGLGCANDLFNLWVWFEVMAVSSYLLVAFYTRQPGSLEAGFKYLVQSAVGSVFILMAIALVFAQAGTLRLDEIALAQNFYTPVVLAAGAQFLIGFGVKTALVPLHTWLPDAHSQAPSGISAMLSGVVIQAGLIAMLRSLGNLPGGLPQWGMLLLAFGAVNMVAGNLMALRQTQVKRMLAYSSLSHIGYMLLAFGVTAVYHNGAAAAGGFFHLFTHAVMKGLAFMSAGVLLYSLHIARGDHAPLTTEDLDGTARRYPLVAFVFSLAVLALGGLPPLAGFMSKWQIFVGGAETQNLVVILLVVFAAINSVISLGYYAPLVSRMYRLQPSAAVKAGLPVSKAMAAPLVGLMVLLVVLGFWPDLVQPITGPAAQNLVMMFGNQLNAVLPTAAGY
jgi:proton-translocating NADH-quinone oxidoreductase chain N